MRTPIVSIIVPVYNVEKYLHRCVDSILAQTFTDFELLLINDGSRDNSGAICDEYAAKDSRIRVFHKENGGLSSARNLGLKNVRGTYIIFVDSDDYWLDLDSLSVLYGVASKFDCDIVRGEYIYVDDNDKYLFDSIDRKKRKYSNVVMPGGDFIEQIVCGKWMACMSLYRGSIVQMFNEMQKFQEDIEFHIRLFANKMSCVYTPLVFYAYRLRQDSLANTMSAVNLEYSFRLCRIFEEYSHKCKDTKTSDLYRYYSVMMYYWNLLTLVRHFYSLRDELVVAFDLSEIQKRTLKLVGYNVLKYPIAIFIRPEFACVLLRVYLSLVSFAKKTIKPFLR